MLCYPELNICNRWKQKESPLDHEEIENCETDKQTIGYQPIDDKFHQNTFKGLLLSITNYKNNPLEVYFLM